MDSQGAGFAFIDANMDFSNVFATKPNEGNTSNDFFFGDEGIDTAVSFGQHLDAMNTGLLSTSHSGYDLQQDLTLDNTSGSTSIWNGHFTSPSQNVLNTFPPTPTQSFESLYQPNYSTALGKRPLQLDAHDFPQAKRHETTDLATFSPSWPHDGLPTASSSVGVGLSDEAADMCATWFSKYGISPSDRHIDSLSQLTGEPTDAIRNWFSRLMKQGMDGGHSDSGYKSQITLPQLDHFWNDFPTNVVQMPHLSSEESTQEAITPEIPCIHETTIVTPPANALRGRKKQRCTPTDDQSLLSRDANKIYQCTRKCGKRYGRKCDWKRKEEEGYPCKSWICSLCTSQGVENVKACFRKYHFAQHFRNIHPGVDCEEYQETSFVCSETDFPRNCGFCKNQFESRQERIDHIADHFKQGKCMLDWNENGSDDNHDSDNNDDNDDHPSGDGFDNNNKPSYPPPDNDPRGGSDSKYYSGGGAQGGFFQFQLSQPKENGIGSQSSCADQHNKPKSNLQHIDQRPRAASEPLHQHSTEANSSSGQQSILGRFGATEGINQSALARDALTMSVTQRYFIDSTPSVDQEKPGVRFAETCNEINELAVLQDPGHDGRAPKAQENQRTDSAACISAGVAQHAQGQPTTKAGALQLAATLASTALREKKNRQSPCPLTLGPKVLQGIPITSQAFRSVKFLGSGGFSTVDEVVHRATNLRLGRKTLKDRDPAAIKELWKEVSVLQKLRHPHVIRFLGAYSRDDKMSILISPVADTTLALWLDRFALHKPASLAQTITKMFGCLASSVRYLHEQRPVVKHMDIKPQNILVVEGDGEFPHVVLCDFGISSSEDLADGQSQPMTRHYAAPEVFEGFTRKQASDIWSLGCVFAEMASVSFSQSNSGWLSFRNEFSGRASKYYWQDVPGLQDRLTILLEEATTFTESTVVRMLKSMLNSQPDERPDAASLTLIFTPAPCCLDWPNEKATYPGPREELSSVEMLLLEDGVTSHAQHLHSQFAVGSGHSLSNAKSWLEQCSHSHEACCQPAPNGAKILPTRLVDIRPEGKEGSYVRVVDSASINPDTDQVEYIALSHVWSQAHVSLSTNSLQAMHTHLPRDLLSPALKAAITAAQGLGSRYIWTDSLCVLQDNEDDKRRECTNMASVFRNAALTLVLDQIDDALKAIKGSLAEGSNFNRDVDLSPNGPKLEPISQVRMNASAALPAADFNTLGFAWDTRAWALQERLLSHRFLYLGPEQMYWECNSLKASETFPQGLPSLIWEKAHSKLESCEGLQPSPTGKCASSINHVASPNVLEQANSPVRRRLRNCQWIKKEGDGIGDSMEAAQTILQIGGAKAFPMANAYGHDGHELTEKIGQVSHDSTTRDHETSCQNCGVASCSGAQRRPNRARHTRLRFSTTAEESATDGTDDYIIIDERVVDSSGFKTSKPSTDARGKLATQDIDMSGQMDQNGSLEHVKGNLGKVMKRARVDDVGDEMSEDMRGE